MQNDARHVIYINKYEKSLKGNISKNFYVCYYLGEKRGYFILFFTYPYICKIRVRVFIFIIRKNIYIL